MRKVILHISYEMNRAKAFAFAGFVFQQFETAPSRPKPGAPVIVAWGDCHCLCRMTEAGTYIMTIEPLPKETP